MSNKKSDATLREWKPNNGDASAFPFEGESMLEWGLTKREYIAVQIMASLLSDPAAIRCRDIYQLAKDANECADALLESWED